MPLTGAKARDLLALTPLAFEAASLKPPARFTSATWDYSLDFTAASAALRWQGTDGKDATLTMRWPGSRATAPEGIARQTGVSNYLVGSDSGLWRTGVAHYGQLRYRNLYPGVDLVFYGDGQKLEFDFVVAPHTDPSAIRMQFDGASRLLVNSAGELEIKSHGRTVRERLPAIYQTIGGKRKSVPGRFLLEGDTVRFALGDYDRTATLVIDPAVITASLAGSGSTVPREVVVDSQSNFYVVGGTTAQDLPTASGVAQKDSGGGPSDVFVTKFDSQGKLVWVTYLGGSGTESSGGLAVDDASNVFIAGSTDSANFPVTSNAFQKTRAGGTDLFLAKLNPAGSAILAATYFGGTANEIPTNLQLDSAGNVYVSGATGSTNLPVKSAAQSTIGGGGTDGFVAKFKADLSDLVFSTFLGGSGTDQVELLRIDSNGSVYATGYTLSTNFKTTAGVQQTSNAGGRDVFLVRLDPTGAILAMSTLLGGSKDDTPTALALAPSGDIYVGGSTASANFPTTAKAFQTVYGGDPTDGFVSHLTPAGTLVASTYFGGPAADSINGLAVLADGSLSVLVTLGSNILNSTSPKKAASYAYPRELLVNGQSDLEHWLYFYDFSFTDSSGNSTLRGCTVHEFYTCCVGTSVDPNTITPSNPTGTRGCMLLCILNAAFGGPNLDLSSAYQNSQSLGDPISTATGELYLAQPDIPRSGVMGLEFSRFYSSHLASSKLTSALGVNWMHNYDAVLSVLADTATAILFTGKSVTFKQTNGAWAMSGMQSNVYQFAVTSSGYQMLDVADNLVYSFDSSGALTRIADRNGNALTIVQSAAGPVSVSDGVGRTLTFTYTAGHLTKVQDQSGRPVLFDYTGNNLTAATDLLGRRTNYTYATSGQYNGLLTAALKPAGNTPQTQTYDDQGRVIKQTDAGGNAITLSYNAGTTTITDPTSTSAQHTYSNTGALSKIVDPDRQAVELSYDSSMHLTTLADRNGGTTGFTYHAPTGYPASSTNSLGNTTSYSYTAQPQNGFTFYNLTGIVYPDGSTASLNYDAKGNVLSRTDGAGAKTSFTYTARGLRETSVRPSGGVATFTYNSDNTLAFVKSPAGDTNSFSYDSAKRLSKITQADGSVREFTHDDPNNVIAIKNEQNDSRSFTFDTNNRIATATDYLGAVKSYQYDNRDQVSAFVDQLGNVTAYTYDEQNRPQSTTMPSGYKLTSTYNSQGRVSGLSDNVGSLWTRTFDREALPVSTTDALGRTWKIARNALGQISQVTGPSGAFTSLSYDKFGRILQFKDSASISLAYTYDAAGRVRSASQGGLVTARFSRDGDGNLTRVADANGSNWDFGFDNAGRMVSKKDPLGNNTAFTYDSQQRISKVTMPSSSLGFTYSGTGLPVRRLYSDGLDLKYTYNKNGQLTDANGIALAYDTTGSIVSSNGTGIARDSSGRIASITMGPGLVVTYTYNERGLLSSVRDWTGGGVDFTFDAARAIKGIARTNGVSTKIAYDADAYASSIVESSGERMIASLALTHDPAGKMLSSDRNLPGTINLPSDSQTYTYDAAGQMGSATYDAQGRMTSDGARTFVWDGASRLTSYTPAGGLPVAFTYDAYGSMIARGPRTFVINYALGPGAVGIVRDGAADKRYYVYTPGGALLYSVEAADNTHRFYHFDESGNTTFLTDDTGAVSDSYGITPFGEVVNSSGQTDNPFTFQGASGVMQEGSSGLYYMRARFYDAATARFLSRDPLSIAVRPLSVNPYQYAELNPVTNGDPTGLGTVTAVRPSDQSYHDAFVRAVSTTLYRDQERRAQVKAYVDWLSTLTDLERAALSVATIQANQIAAKLGYPAGDPRIEALRGSLYNDIGGIVSKYGAALVNQNGAGLITSVASLVAKHSGALVSDVVSLIGPNGAALLNQDALGLQRMISSLIGQDGSGLIGQDGSGIVAAGAGNLFALANALIGQDGSGLIGQDGSGLIGQDGSGLIQRNGGSLR